MVLHRNQKGNYKFGKLACWTLALSLAGCAITINTIQDSSNTRITNEQKASQKNDSTQLNNNLKF